jgi:predicted ArsR family transcriptional regulator
MNVEDVFSSRIRVKILKILTQVGELNVSDIARRLKVNYTTTRTHLEVLENEGMLLHKKFGRIRIYRLNERSEKTRASQGLLEAWEHEAAQET